MFLHLCPPPNTLTRSCDIPLKDICMTLKLLCGHLSAFAWSVPLFLLITAWICHCTDSRDINLQCVSARRRKFAAFGQNSWQNVPVCVCCVFSRWALEVDVLSLWLLLQEPQKRARGRERHLLQRALHFMFWDPVGGQLPSRYRDLWPCEQALQRPDAGPSHAQRAHPHAAAGRDAPQDWHAPRENLRRPWARGRKEESEQGEDDSGAGAGEMHPGLPSH